MTLLAIGVGNAILGSITVVVALTGAVAAVALLNRVARPAREIDRYAEDILETSRAIASNLEGVDELARTRELGTSVPALVSDYLERPRGTRT